MGFHFVQVSLELHPSESVALKTSPIITFFTADIKDQFMDCLGVKHSSLVWVAAEIVFLPG